MSVGFIERSRRVYRVRITIGGIFEAEKMNPRFERESGIGLVIGSRVGGQG